MKRIIVATLLGLFAVTAAAQSNLIYGPWVSQIGQNGFTVL